LTARSILIFLLLFWIPSAGRPATLGQNHQEILQWLRQASALRSGGNYQESLFSVQKALDISLQLSGSPFDGKCLLLTGLLKWDLGAVEESSRYFAEARTAFERILDLRSRDFCTRCLELIGLYLAGKESRQARLYFRAVGQFERAGRIGRELGIEGFCLKCLRQQALAYLDMGKFDLFLDNSRRGLAIAIKLHHRIEQARCENNIGVYYQQRSSFSQAAGHFEKALSALGNEGDIATEAECLNNLGLVYRELGYLDRACHDLRGALALDRRSGGLTAISVDLINLGSVYMRQGIDNANRDDLLQSLKCLQEGLSLLEGRQADVRIRFAALNNIGVVLNELKDHGRARRQFRRALAIAQEGHYALEQCQVLNNLAVSFMDEQDIDEALVQYRASLRVGADRQYDSILMDCFYGIGQCYELRHDDLAALANYRKSIDALERMRGRIPSEPFSIGFARNRYKAYEKAIHLLIMRQSAAGSGPWQEDLFDLVERAKARAFLENVHEALVDLSPSDRIALKGRQKIISDDIAQLSKKLADPGLSREDEIGLANELEREEDEYIRLATDMKAQGADQEVRWRESVRSLSEVQRFLSTEDAILFEYHLGESESCLLVVSSAESRLFLLPQKSQLEASLRAYLRFVSDRSLDPAEGFRPAERIWRELIPLDLRQDPFRAKRLIVIPDGILHHLPFEALRMPVDSGSKYLVECLTISYCPSASALWLLRNTTERGTWKKDLLAIGAPEYDLYYSGSGLGVRSRPLLPSDPFGIPDVDLPSLPFSQREILDIASLFPATRADVLSGGLASESRLKRMTLADYQIIHFACHGTLDERYPYRSALVLSRAEAAEDDGWLQTREIYGMSLNASLVVLSACQTAKGHLESAEGPMALTRPFFFAGARSLVASLWKINDQATVHFMREFYRNLLLGRSKSDSLRSAKLWMLRSAWNHPFYWASFMLQGDPSAIAVAH
jgi:CHAT domain-containing protein/Tfp pilus assembly protein PilF